MTEWEKFVRHCEREYGFSEEETRHFFRKEFDDITKNKNDDKGENR